MLASLKQFFSEIRQQQPETAIDLHLAIAVLLAEVAQADMRIGTGEKAKIASMMKRAFDLDQARIDALLAEAIELQASSVSMQTYTQVLKQDTSYEQRVRFVEAMWQVAYSDQVLDPYEDHIIRKIAELLYVKHSDFIKTKLKVAPEQSN
ncbi:TerB family tellurite resistance protein [Motilimonas pumila]|uniref:TerB family tellurite resistance protein n=1 Tax=Motilimonas pumila TaxID=2303987 RepID=A0A418YD03_9GAMM|nr:TerB family tellurite resistance protein [Motilimonas pumila]RJG42400.1 TerB family tellurite resistance protein [Motilimonas pumila]